VHLSGGFQRIDDENGSPPIGRDFLRPLRPTLRPDEGGGERDYSIAAAGSTAHFIAGIHQRFDSVILRKPSGIHVGEEADEGTHLHFDRVIIDGGELCLQLSFDILKIGASGPDQADVNIGPVALGMVKV
jgi:hypothetical protein